MVDFATSLKRYKMSILSQVLYNPKSRLDCFDKKFGPKIENASKKLVKVQYKVVDYM